MIDDPDKTQNLITDMKASLPLTARLSPNLQAMMRQQVPGVAPPNQCSVIEVFYMGAEGGIACRLDLNGKDTQDPFVVSMTHLTFDRRCPLFRQIDRYQKHRIKKLKKQQGGTYRYS